MAPKKHPGFKAVAKKIASKEGLPLGAASAILAKSSMNASPAAKKANPALKRVAHNKGKFLHKASPARYSRIAKK